MKKLSAVLVAGGIAAISIIGFRRRKSFAKTAPVKLAKKALFTLSNNGSLDVSENLSGDWKAESADIYYGFRNGIFYVTDQKGFEDVDWKKGTYSLRKAKNGSHSITLATYDNTVTYGFEPVDERTIRFFTSPSGKVTTFKAVCY